MSVDCSFGEFYCVTSSGAGLDVEVTSNSVFFRPISFSYLAGRFFWEVGGTGYYLWIDDYEPYFGSGTFVFSDISATGLPSRPLPGCEPSGGQPNKCDPVNPVPLPATLPLFFVGLFGLFGLGFRRRIQA